MVRDLDFPVRIHVSPIVRESDGLAMSSRNARLSAGERERALSLSRGLKKAEQLFAGGVVSAAELREAVVATLTAASVEVDYVDIVDPDSLEAVDSVAAGALVAVAARVGQTRLIDNCVLPARR